jgi:squalene-hopene/tetraprenyl-beta-curcumene cyclase
MERHVEALAPENRKDKDRWHFLGAGPTLAAGLAFHDRHAGAELRPTTRKALSTMWSLKSNQSGWKGGWHSAWHGGSLCSGFCYDLSAPELDQQYAAILAAVAVGTAPDDYARSNEAQKELKQFRHYLADFFGKRQDQDLHQKALYLWASCRLDGLLNATERKATAQDLLAAQCADGGWSLAEMAKQSRWHGRRAKERPSDGYATGLVIYVLRQAGLPADQPELVRGIAWLKKHQRVSGGWFTPDADPGGAMGGIGTHDLAILNLGTAFAVMALHECDVTSRK